jgi:hypothetical protein
LALLGLEEEAVAAFTAVHKTNNSSFSEEVSDLVSSSASSSSRARSSAVGASSSSLPLGASVSLYTIFVPTGGAREKRVVSEV